MGWNTCRERTWHALQSKDFIFVWAMLLRVSDKDQFHATARLLVSSVTSTELSNYNVK